VFDMKLLLLLAILAAGAAGGSMPLWRGGSTASPRLLGWGNSFAAGVFLAAGLVHMLPDADAVFRDQGFGFPIAFALAAAALTGMLLIEHVLLPDHVHEEVHVPSDERFGGHHGHAHHDALSAYSALVALSIHSFIGGLALGAEQDTSRILVIFFAIFAHKSAEGFALGVSLARSAISPALARRLIAIFATSTPIGGLIGMALGQAIDGPLAARVEAVFLSLAAGTFMYVATFDVLRDEFPQASARFSTWLAMALGVCGMSLLAIWS
jgi:solute carrier family 39 (zinc transporter), member 1/2/3